MLNTFEISRVLENVESWSVYADTLFWIVQPYFSTAIIKEVSISFFFLLFKTFNEKKKEVSHEVLLFQSL